MTILDEKLADALDDFRAAKRIGDSETRLLAMMSCSNRIVQVYAVEFTRSLEDAMRRTAADSGTEYMRVGDVIDQLAKLREAIDSIPPLNLSIEKD